MAANLYERSIIHDGKGASWYFLADESLVMDATIVMSRKNTGNVVTQFVGMTASPMEMMSAAWPPGSTIHLRNVDLSKISFYVPADHHVLVVGQAP